MRPQVGMSAANEWVNVCASRVGKYTRSSLHRQQFPDKAGGAHLFDTTSFSSQPNTAPGVGSQAQDRALVQAGAAAS